MTAAAGSDSMPIARDEADIYTYTELSSEAAPAPLRPFFSPLPLKWVLLLLLVFQNSASTILVTHTRSISPLPGRPLYLGSAAVLVSECLKLSSCLAMITHEEGGVKQAAAEVWLAVVVRWRDTRRMAVPALCYGLQNVLFYVALSNLTPTAYQLWSQSKTLVTALFFVTILKQVLKPRQWFALGLLTAGVGLVQVAEVAAKAGGAASVAASAGGAAPMVALGVAAVLASSVLSGFANVYFEKVLIVSNTSKSSGPACWGGARRRPPVSGVAICYYKDASPIRNPQPSTPPLSLRPGFSPSPTPSPHRDACSAKVLKEADLSCEIDETCAPASLWMRNVQQGIFAIPQAAYLVWPYLPWSLFTLAHGPRCTTYYGYTHYGAGRRAASSERPRASNRPHPRPACWVHALGLARDCLDRGRWATRCGGGQARGQRTQDLRHGGRHPRHLRLHRGLDRRATQRRLHAGPPAGHRKHVPLQFAAALPALPATAAARVSLHRRLQNKRTHGVLTQTSVLSVPRPTVIRANQT